MLAQYGKIIRKTFTKRSKKNLLWNRLVTFPCDIFEALPEPFNIYFFSACGKKYVIANVYGFRSVAAADTDQNKYRNFLERNN